MPERDLRTRAMTAASVSLRSDSGFSSPNIMPVLLAPPMGPPPPVKATTCSTAGSWCTTFTMLRIFSCIAWKEMLWSAITNPISEPELPCGKKPFGTMPKR